MVDDLERALEKRMGLKMEMQMYLELDRVKDLKMVLVEE